MAKKLVTCEHAFSVGRNNPKKVTIMGRGDASVSVFSQGTVYYVDDKDPDVKRALAAGQLVPVDGTGPVERATKAPGEKKTTKAKK